MEKRMRNYLALMKGLNYTEMSEEERGKRRTNLLIQIGFFQQERLIHLIVTATFALLLLISTLASVISQELVYLLLSALFLVLLIPYIRHYYILENGVQRLYLYYDMLED